MEFIIYSRAVRRHHLARLKHNRLSWFGAYMKSLPSADRAACAGRLANTATPCSCYMCGNPRRYRHEETVQERRFWAGA